MNKITSPREDGLNEDIDRWHELPDDVSREARYLVPGLVLGEAADVWAAASRPRDYTSSLRLAVHDTARLLTRYRVVSPGMNEEPGPLALSIGRRLVELAGRHHRFCTKRVVTAGLETSGPHLCGAPLNDDGSCPARDGHRAMLAREGRNMRLQHALSSLHAAMHEQARSEQPDEIGELVVGLEQQARLVIAALAAYEKVEPRT